MSVKIDARGKECPLPIIETKKELSKLDKGVVEVLVDNHISAENIEKLAIELSYNYEILPVEGAWAITITKEKRNIKEQIESEELVIVVTSDEMGSGEEELGKALMNSFLFTLSEGDILPSKVIFYNKGALLTDRNSKSIEDLLDLERRGVKIYTCGACIKYYETNLGVGESTNMLEIVNFKLKAKKVVSV